MPPPITAWYSVIGILKIKGSQLYPVGMFTQGDSFTLHLFTHTDTSPASPDTQQDTCLSEEKEDEHERVHPHIKRVPHRALLELSDEECSVAGAGVFSDDETNGQFCTSLSSSKLSVHI